MWWWSMGGRASQVFVVRFLSPSLVATGQSPSVSGFLPLPGPVPTPHCSPAGARSAVSPVFSSAGLSEALGGSEYVERNEEEEEEEDGSRIRFGFAFCFRLVDVAAQVERPTVPRKNTMEVGFEKEAVTPFLSLFAALSYGVSSMAMVFINKAILMQYSYSMTLLTVQQLATAVLIHSTRVLGYSRFKGVNMETAKKLLAVSLFYNANVAFALASLKGVNIPMYIALKRLTPLAVLVAGFIRGKGKPTTQVSLSVVLVALGVIIAALGDFSFDLFGYSMALTSVFFQTMYLVLVEKSGAEDGLSSTELMLYNAILSLPFLFFLIIATGEFPYSISLLYGKANSLPFLVILILSLAMGIVLNYTMFLCTVVNSALTTTIVGVLKGVVSTTLGFVLLGGVQVHGLNVTGLAINTAGGVWYSYAKYQLKISKQKKIITDAEAHVK